MSKYVFASETVFVADPDGIGTMQLTVNMPYLSTERIVQTRPELFSDIPPRLRDAMPIVEQTTANPGERRARNA